MSRVSRTSAHSICRAAVLPGRFSPHPSLILRYLCVFSGLRQKERRCNHVINPPKSPSGMFFFCVCVSHVLSKKESISSEQPLLNHTFNYFKSADSIKHNLFFETSNFSRSFFNNLQQHSSTTLIFFGH